MPLMCEDCFSQYNIKRRSGLYCKVCGGDLVEIDEAFIEAIILLNEKGYYTKYCCSGHPDPKRVPYSYIYFEKDVRLPFLPAGYSSEEHEDFRTFETRGIIVSKDFEEKENLALLQREILQNAILILDWAISLPDINDIEN